MKRIISTSLFTCLMAGLPVMALGQSTDESLPETYPDPRSVNVEISGHVLEPESLPATPDRIADLKLPAGFEVNVFARDLINPRMIATADNGSVYVTRRSVGDVLMLRDNDGDGEADQRQVVASRPDLHGIAIDGETMYLVTVKELYRAAIGRNGSLGELELLLDDLPGAGQHPNRTVNVGPDGKLYLSVGSSCNACSEANPENAAILQVEPDGSKRTIFATGLRNTIGFDFHPASGELYGMDQGMDWLGDNAQHEELNHIVKGGQYGWPYIYGDSRFNPQDQPTGDLSLAQWAQQSKEPVGYYTPHAAPMQMVFYTGEQFPEEYRNDAFVSMRGSWNRKPPSGYELVRIAFDESGKPVGFEPFLTGFLVEHTAVQEEQAAVAGSESPDAGSEAEDASSGARTDTTEAETGWGQTARLAGLAQAKDGALLVSDDHNGIIYRIAYTGEADAADSETPTFTNPGQASVRVDPAAIAETTPDAPPQLTSVLLGTVETQLKLSSPAFTQDGEIPEKYGAEGENISPALNWEKGPEGTASYALIVEDPNVVTKPPFVHWIIYNLPADVTQLREGIPALPMLTLPKGVLQGGNDRGSLGYYGPRPPKDDPPHPYHFQLLALDKQLDLPFGATRAEFIDAVRGHVIGVGELTGTFER